VGQSRFPVELLHATADSFARVLAESVHRPECAGETEQALSLVVLGCAVNNNAVQLQAVRDVQQQAEELQAPILWSMAPTFLGETVLALGIAHLLRCRRHCRRHCPEHRRDRLANALSRPRVWRHHGSDLHWRSEHSSIAPGTINSRAGAIRQRFEQFLSAMIADTSHGAVATITIEPDLDSPEGAWVHCAVKTGTQALGGTEVQFSLHT